MKNRIFQAAVKEAFDKLAWPHDLNNVTPQVPADVAKDVERGRSIGRGAVQAGKNVPGALRAGGRLVDRILKPAGPGVAKPFFGALRGVKDYALAHPGMTRSLVGLSLLAPILGESFQGAQQGYEDQLMHMREDPSRTITASLDEFLEKKAAYGGPMSFPQMGGSLQNSLAGGVGSGIGQGIITALGGALSNGIGGLKDLFVTDRKRRQVFEQSIASDPTIHQAVQMNPEMVQNLEEAYQTMAKFAPTLALDINAVRSLLKEVVVTSGAGINYATIKNLIETEKALHYGVK